MEIARETNVYNQIEKLWDISNTENNSDWGIKGYKVPPLNIDLAKNKKDREEYEIYEEFLKHKKSYTKVNEKYDRDGNIKVPQKESYFDTLVKQNSYEFNEDKEIRLKRKHSDHNRHFNDEKDIINTVKVVKEKEKSILYREERETIFDELIKNQEKNEEVPSYKENIIKKVKDEIENEHSRNIKSLNEVIKEKYKNKGSFNKDLKVNILDEYQYFGEKVPFYSTPNLKDLKHKNQEKEKSNFNKAEELFFPNIESISPHSPSFAYYKPMKTDKFKLEKRDEIKNEKMSLIKKKWIENKITFIDDISISYGKLHALKGSIVYKKPTKKTEQYKIVKKKNRTRSPGPQSYFKTPKYEKNKKSYKKEFPIDILEKKWARPMNKVLF